MSKTDLEELGENTEDLAEGFSKYAKEIQSLTGFNIMIDDTHFKDLYDIMEGIAGVWDKLSDTQQARVAEILGGTRQLQVISSIIGNWSDAAGAYETAMNSAGASTKANDIYMQDVTAHINQFKAAFEELSITIMKGGMLNFFIDIGKGLVSLVTTLEKMHLLIPAIIASIIAVKGIKIGAETVKTAAAVSSLVTKIVNEKVVTDQLAASVMGLNFKQRQALATQIQAKVAAGALTAEQGQQILSTLGLATADGTLVVANKGLAASFKSVMASIPVWGWIALGVSLVIEVIGALTNSVDEAGDKLQEATDQLSDTQSEIDSINSELKTTKERIDELNKKDKLTLVEQNELERLQKVNAELERKLELEKAHKRTQSKTVVDQAMKDFNDLQSGGDTGFLVPKAGGDLAGVAQIWAYQQDQTEESRKALEDYYQSLMKIKESLEDVDPSALTQDAKDALAFIDKFEDMYMVAFGDAKSLSIVFENIFNSSKYKDAQDLFRQLSQAGELTAEILQGIFNYGKKGFILPNILAGFSNEQLKSAQELLLYLQEIGLIKYDNLEEGFSGFVNQFNALISKEKELDQQTQTTVKDLAEIKEALDSAKNAYSTVASAISEYQETGVLNSDTLAKLLELEPEYLNLLMDESGQLNLNSESYERLIRSKLENMVVSRMQSAFNQVLEMSVEEAQAYATATAYDAETESIYSLLGARMKLAMDDAMEKDRANNTNAYSQAIMRVAESYAPLVSAVEDYNIQSENAEKITKDSTKATNEQKEALESQKKALEESKKALESYKNDLSDAKSAIEKLVDAVSDYIKQQKEEEKAALQERKEAFDELIEKEKEELEAKRESAKLADELADKENAYAKSSLAASAAALDDSAAGRKAQKQANDALESSRKDLMSTLSDHEYDVRVKVLDQLKETNDEYYDSEIKKISDYLSDARKIYEDACSMIENDTGDLYSKLWEYTYKHTTQTRAEFDFMWEQAKAALGRYDVAQRGVIGVMEFLQSTIYDTEQQINDLDGVIGDLSTTISNVSDSISSLANNGLSNVAARISDIKDEYRKLLEQMNQQMAPKWHYEWQGNTYQSAFEDRDAAVAHIRQQIASRYGGVFPASAATVDSMIKHYRNGTNSAAGGISLVGEAGAELRVINPGDGIITNRITRGLAALGAEGQSIIEAGKRLLSTLFRPGVNSSINAISPSTEKPITVINHIQGDVNPSTLKALVAAQEQIIRAAKKDIMSDTLKNRSTSRVR